MKNLRPYSNITENALNTGLDFDVPKFELTATNSSFTRLPNPINAIKKPAKRNSAIHNLPITTLTKQKVS
jgi:hypothetical protein